MQRYLFIVAIFVCLTMGSCGGGSSSGSNNETIAHLEDIGCEWTEDSTEYICVDTEGNLVSLADGVITTKSNGGTEELTIYYGINGLPTRMVIGNEIFVYDWDTTNSKVDLAFIDDDDSITLQRNISVSASAISDILGLADSFTAPIGNAGAGNKAWPSIQENPWWYIGKVAGGVTCIGALGVAYVSAGTSEIVLAGQGVMVTCGLLVVSTAYENTIASEIVPEGEYLAIGIEAIQCPSNAAECLQTGVDTLSVLTEAAIIRTEGASTEIENAEASLEGGGGAVKVTLRWEREVDLDLHVIDPEGEEIYYGDKTSSSGGELDVDDTNGGTASDPAIENIAWTANAPSGTYTYYVKYYSGSGSTNYTLAIYLDDVLYGSIISGTVSSAGGQSTSATFTYPQ